jgi:signal transduction histidine kinase
MVGAQLDGAHALIQIEDSGRGMTAKQLETIFEFGFDAQGNQQGPV